MRKNKSSTSTSTTRSGPVAGTSGYSSTTPSDIYEVLDSPRYKYA